MKELIKTLQEQLHITNEEFNVVNDSFYRRLNDGGDLSIILGESYMAGEWTTNDLLALFRKVMVVDNFYVLFFSTFKNAPMKTTKLLLNILLSDIKLQLSDKLKNNQTIKLAKRVAEQHYDIPEILYEKMMDSHMQYTCGYLKPDTITLEEAQQNKINLIIDKLQIPEDTKMTILDIGCGWGGLTRAISKRYPKCKVEGITISNEQLEYVDEKYGSKKLKYYYCDYRDLLKKKKKYDRITVVGMIEHVGIKNYKELFKICEQILSDDGIFVLHSITQHKQAKYITGSKKTATTPWIDKYIFPGGYAPTAEQLLYSAQSTGLMYHHVCKIYPSVMQKHCKHGIIILCYIGQPYELPTQVFLHNHSTICGNFISYAVSFLLKPNNYNYHNMSLRKRHIRICIFLQKRKTNNNSNNSLNIKTIISL